MKMAKKNSREYCSIAAIRYAKVLFEMGTAETVIAESAQILEETPELLETLGNPVVSKEQKRRLIDRIFPKEIQNFLKVVTDYGKSGILQEIFTAYEEQKDEMAGILTAYLDYVVPPTKEQQQKMEQFVCGRFHAKEVKWEMKEKPELIGGFLLRVNGREYDYSMQGRLKRLEQKLTWR